MTLKEVILEDHMKRWAEAYELVHPDTSIEDFRARYMAEKARYRSKVPNPDSPVHRCMEAARAQIKAEKARRREAAELMRQKYPPPV